MLVNEEAYREAHYDLNYANYDNGYKTEANIFLILLGTAWTVVLL